jgi:DNA modification methylase
MTKLIFETWPIDRLTEYARNPRKNDHAVDKIAGAIKEFGFRIPVVAKSDGLVVDGHLRLKAAKKLGLTEVPVILADDMTDAQIKAFRISVNRMAEFAEWDNDLLALEFDELTELGFDLDLTGFTAEEIAALTPEQIEPGLTDEDAVPDVPEQPVTVLGDVWVLGKHRLMCGDSTSIDDGEKLMGGLLADLVFTDPPYNVAYSGQGANNLGTIKNDDMSEEDFEQFCRDVFSTYNIIMKPLACIYVCHPDSASAPKIAFEKTFAEQFKKSSTIIWMKQSAGMGWQDYRAQHEPILYGWKEGKGSHFNAGDRTKTSVWKIGRDAQSSYVHPTQKPVCLPEEAIMNSSKGSDCVVDLFGGSGSTLIACEKTGRINRSMELDPKYCDVIIKRWQDFTGKIAIHAETGQPFAEVTHEKQETSH